MICFMRALMRERLFHDPTCIWLTRWSDAMTWLTGYIYYAEKMW